MEEDRLALHAALEELLPSFFLYFNLPNKSIIEYPCVVYKLSTLEPTYANNRVYSVGSVFELTLMDRLPGFNKVKDVLALDYSRFVRSYISDDIIHYVYVVTVRSVNNG